MNTSDAMGSLLLFFSLHNAHLFLPSTKSASFGMGVIYVFMPLRLFVMCTPTSMIMYYV